jgi:hypothetical protein
LFDCQRDAIADQAEQVCIVGREAARLHATHLQYTVQVTLCEQRHAKQRLHADLAHQWLASVKVIDNHGITPCCNAACQSLIDGYPNASLEFVIETEGSLN